jgi:exonuclease III
MSHNNCSPEVICLQEIWQVVDFDMYRITGYHKPLFRTRSNNVQGGGVAIYVKSCFTVNELPQYSVFIDKIIETIFVEIITPSKKKITIGSLYRSNSKSTSLTEMQQLSQFNETLSNILSDLSEAERDVYLLGDLNIDLLKYKSSSIATDFVESIFSHGFLQIITHPTRCIGNSATLIDHVITNNIQSAYESCIIISRISDHYPVVSFINNPSKKLSPAFHQSRDFTPENIAS